MENIIGVDRSHLNEHYQLSQLVKQGISFCFFKATQGISTPETTFFNQSWQEAKTTQGLIRGAYHFYDPRFDGIEQAKNYLSRGVNFSALGCLPPWVDVEDLVGYDESGKVSQSESDKLNKWVADNWQLALSRLNDFLAYVKAETGRDCGIYTYNTYMREYYKSHPFPNNPMWLSSLQSTCPVRYDTGHVPAFWQYIYNWNNTDMDGNKFMSDLTALKALANFKNITI